MNDHLYKRPFHWLPCQGEADSTLERIIQGGIKLIAWLPVYTALIATITLLLIIFGVPFTGGN